MKVDYSTTISELQQKGLIGPEDKWLACQDAVSNAAVFWGGAIGAALASTNMKYYIISVNEKGFKLFEVDKKSGAYLGYFTPIEKHEIIKLKKPGKMSANLSIAVGDSKIKLLLPVKQFGFKQKEQQAAMIDFINSYY